MGSSASTRLARLMVDSLHKTRSPSHSKAALIAAMHPACTWIPAVYCSMAASKSSVLSEVCVTQVQREGVGQRAPGCADVCGRPSGPHQRLPGRRSVRLICSLPCWHAHAASLAVSASCAAGTCKLLTDCHCQLYCQSAHAVSKALTACSAQGWTKRTRRDFWHLQYYSKFCQHAVSASRMLLHACGTL